jgi:hypothetical protein
LHKNKKKLNNIALLILLVGSTLQYGDYIVSRYFIPLCSIIIGWLILIFTIKTFNKYEKKLFQLHLYSFTGFAVISLVGLGDLDEYIFDVIKLFLAFSSSFLVFYFIVKADWTALNKSLLIMFYSAIIFLFLESIGRGSSVLTFEFSRVIENFYLAKINSPYMVDANAVGLYALIYLLLASYIIIKSWSSKIWKYKLIYTMLSVFVLLTLSRTAIAGLIVVMLIFVYKYLYNKFKILTITLYIVLAIFLIIYIFGVILEDGSGKTKLGVIESLIEIGPNLDLRGILFGFGINEGNYVYSYEAGKYSHLLIPMVLGQFGLIGFYIYFLYFAYILYLSKGSLLIFYGVLAMVGLSYLHPFLETIYFANGLLLGIYYKYWKENIIN